MHTLNLLYKIEKELILQSINEKFLHDSFAVIDKNLEDKINIELSKQSDNIIHQVHKQQILDLIYTYLAMNNLQGAINGNFLNDGERNFSLVKNVRMEEIPFLCEELHISFLNSKFVVKNGSLTKTKSKANLIEAGAVYTKLEIAECIIEQAVMNYSSHSSIQDSKILDFACGTGRFYDGIINVLKNKYHITPKTSILNNIFAVDIDPIAINITRLKALSYFSHPTMTELEIISQRIISRNALIVKSLFKESTETLIDSYDFGGLVNGGFDIIVSNPPYLVLKVNKNKGNNDFQERIKSQVSYFRNSGLYNYSTQGMLNYYQISIEAILRMLRDNGEIGIICPSSLFADTSATNLRRHLLMSHKMRSIEYFPEKEKLFENVTQSINIFHLQKGSSTDQIMIKKDGHSFNVSINLVKELFPKQFEIPMISEVEWRILEKFSHLTTLGSTSHIRNKRGELDLTLFKEYITDTPTKYRLVRGNMITGKGIVDKNNEFVIESFTSKKSVDFLENDFNKERLICQQISNMGVNKRLRFVFSDAHDILGNSCNYISSDKVTLQKLYLILNSTILNWRFKITSSNNHINNYELDDLPIINLDSIDGNYQYLTQKELDNYIGKLYGLSETEINIIENI